MKITRDEARRIAQLAHLAFDDASLDRMAAEMTKILTYIERSVEEPLDIRPANDARTIAADELELVARTALGGAGVHERNGVCHGVVGDDEAAVRHVRMLLSLLPQHGGDHPPSRSRARRRNACSPLMAAM